MYEVGGTVNSRVRPTSSPHICMYILYSCARSYTHRRRHAVVVFERTLETGDYVAKAADEKVTGPEKKTLERCLPLAADPTGGGWASRAMQKFAWVSSCLRRLGSLTRTQHTRARRRRNPPIDIVTRPQDEILIIFNSLLHTHKYHNFFLILIISP